MADLRTPPPACLFVALLYPRVDQSLCIQELIKLFGPVSYHSPTYDMAAFSRYYETEMGPDLQKQFVAFAEPIQMDELADCKLATHSLEQRLWREPGRRVFNIDPGLATSYSVILSTLKNHAHRVYLRDGVFCEVTLIFRDSSYHPLPWTYPDYQSPLVLEFFTKIRDLALQSRKQNEGTGGHGDTGTRRA
ncbi:MAG TPA: DUF4416 family protein [Acidobacteriota bacterium]|jgi:hypothetical protein